MTDEERLRRAEAYLNSLPISGRGRPVKEPVAEIKISITRDRMKYTQSVKLIDSDKLEDALKSFADKFISDVFIGKAEGKLLKTKKYI